MMTIMRNIMLTPYIVFAMAFFAFVLTCRLKVRTQAVWTMVLLACSAKFHVFRYICGSAFNPPEIPDWAIIGWGLAFVWVSFLGCLALPLVWWRSKVKAWLLPTVAFAISLIGVWNAIKIPELREVRLPFANLPPGLDGYRIAVITDIHCSASARRWRTERIVERVNSAKVDLICILGDNVDGQVADRLADVEPLKGLRAPDGVFAVAGNHEYYHDYYGWMSVYERLGLRFLENECAFPRPGLAVGGVPDMAAQRRHLTLPDVAKAFKAATNGEFRVLLQHQPRSAHANLEGHGIDLQLSGHTHGGFMPVFMELVRRFNNGFLSGVYEFGDRKLLVSKGVGQWAGFPIRICSSAELPIVVLESGKRHRQ